VLRVFELTAAMWLVIGIGGASAVAQQAAAPQGPDFSIGVEQFPEDDAIILRWEQHWTLENDGTIRRRDHKWTRLLNSRPIRALADPRLDVCVGEDELTIHTARTILPDGKVVPVADYSFNKTGPDDVAGWPAYVAWEQTVVSFGGIEDNSVLELDYEIMTKSGVLPWVEGHLRLHQDYPTVERIVSVTVPAGTVVKHRVDRMPAAVEPVVESLEGGGTRYAWRFTDLPGTPAEPQSPAWRMRCGQLKFTTCLESEAWVRGFVNASNRAAQPHEKILAFAKAATEGETDDVERVRKVAKKLRDSFNFIDSRKTYRSLSCREAADVLQRNYGNPLEAAALLAAMLRSLGLRANPVVVVDGLAWKADLPMTSAFEGMAVVALLPEGPVRVHPRHGVFDNPGHWGRRWLLGFGARGNLTTSKVQARGEKGVSVIQVSGTVKIDGDARLTGELRISLTGSFYDPRELRTAAKQKAFVEGIAGRVLSDCKVTDYSIETLSIKTLKATVKVASDGVLKHHGDRHILQFGEGPAFLADFPLPLDRSYRKTDVSANGQFGEMIKLTVELSEDWQAAVLPAELPRAVGDWGLAEQFVTVEDQRIHLKRRIGTSTRWLPKADFEHLRKAINQLRTDRSRTLVIVPAAP
jgi:hypothetical protein